MSFIGATFSLFALSKDQVLVVAGFGHEALRQQ
jgi:hypothetical protein